MWTAPLRQNTQQGHLFVAILQLQLLSAAAKSASITVYDPEYACLLLCNEFSGTRLACLPCQTVATASMKAGL